MLPRPPRFSRVVAVLALPLLAVLTALPAHAAAARYVALGDSYASGTGTGRYLADGTSCQRSVYAYPSLLASSRGLALTFRACSGATTSDVARLQLDALGPGTAYASISVGGNDAGFSRVLTECAKPAWASNCHAAIDRARAVIRRTLPARLTALYASVRQRAPRAEVVVVGYPRIFNGEDCNALTWFSPTEESRLNATADLLNAEAAAAARDAGFTFTNPTRAFTHHAVCDRPEWLNGLSNPISSSYHPNRSGHASGYLPLVGAALTGTPVLATPATLQQAAGQRSRLTSQQARYTDGDRTIAHRPFIAPDLGSRPLREAAARAGVDLASRRSIDAADRRYGAQQTRAAASKAARRGESLR